MLRCREPDQRVVVPGLGAAAPKRVDVGAEAARRQVDCAELGPRPDDLRLKTRSSPPRRSLAVPRKRSPRIEALANRFKCSVKGGVCAQDHRPSVVVAVVWLRGARKERTARSLRQTDASPRPGSRSRANRPGTPGLPRQRPGIVKSPAGGRERRVCPVERPRLRSPSGHFGDPPVCPQNRTFFSLSNV